MESRLILSFKKHPLKRSDGRFECEVYLLKKSAFKIIDKEPTKIILSEKQTIKLNQCFILAGGESGKHCEVHGIFDNGRFVWCGTRDHNKSELGFLSDRFGVEFFGVFF